jgi:uncharacterized OB-fold protein
MQKPLPTPTAITQPFWDALRQHKVRLQKCRGCARLIHYPRSRCPNCLSDRLDWTDVSGNGAVYTFTIARRATAPQFQDEIPQRIAIVQLDEGPRLTTTLVNVEDADIKVGMRVRPVFEDQPGSEITLLRYEPV